LRPAVQPSLLAVFEPESEFRRYGYLPAKRSERFSDKLFVHIWAVHLGSIEECYTAFHRGANDGDHLAPVSRRAVSEAHAHAAQTNGGHFQPAFSQNAFLHRVS